jgi:hypothetical protein
MKSVTTIARCCCCRQLLPPKIVFGGHQQLLWDRVLTAYRPPTNKELFEFLYGDAKDGGPLAGAQIIYHIIKAINRRLARKRILLKIASIDRIGYRIVEITREESDQITRWDQKRNQKTRHYAPVTGAVFRSTAAAD